VGVNITIINEDGENIGSWHTSNDGEHIPDRFVAEIVEIMDAHLDSDVDEQFKAQPLAQDWARISKVAEELGEAIDAFIGVTGQNPRKGKYGSEQDLYDELADVALTALYGLQHFVKDRNRTMQILTSRANYHARRVGL